jgi:hypothetical protein
MKTIQFVQLRNNSSLDLDVESDKLVAHAEIIIIGLKPEYRIDNISQTIQRSQEATDIRFKVNLQNVNGIIRDLEIIKESLTVFNEMANELNGRITVNKIKTTKDENEASTSAGG